MASRYRFILFILCMPFLALALLWLGTRAWVVHVEDSYPPLGRFLELNDRRVHLLEAGEGAPVVMLHGASSNVREWQASIFGRVAGRHHAIAIDRPGHGWSERNGADDHDPRVQAEIVHAALDDLGVRRPVLVAHSFAGTVALAYALAHPDDVGGILFLSGVSHPWPGGVGWFQDVAAVPVLCLPTPCFCPAIWRAGNRLSRKPLHPIRCRKAMLRRRVSPFTRGRRP